MGTSGCGCTIGAYDVISAADFMLPCAWAVMAVEGFVALNAVTSGAFALTVGAVAAWYVATNVVFVGAGA